VASFALTIALSDIAEQGGVVSPSDDLAVVTGTTGEEFAPFVMTYTLRRAEGTWRIVVATIYRIHSKL